MARIPGATIDPKFLRRFELFATVSDRDAEALARAFQREDFRAGEQIFAEGDPGDRLYLVAVGSVRISQMLGTMKEEALAILRPGQCFGDMSIIDSQPRSAHAFAHEPCVLYSIDQGVFLTILQLDANLAINVLFQFLRSLSGRLRDSNEKIRAMNIMAMW